MITWEADYPHSDSTWPQSPEILMKSLEAARLRDDEIDKVTWENAGPLVQLRSLRPPGPGRVHGRGPAGRSGGRRHDTA